MDIQFTDTRAYPKMGPHAMRCEVWAEGELMGAFTTRDGKYWQHDSQLAGNMGADISGPDLDELKPAARTLLEG